MKKVIFRKLFHLSPPVSRQRNLYCKGFSPCVIQIYLMYRYAPDFKYFFTNLIYSSIYLSILPLILSTLFKYTWTKRIKYSFWSDVFKKNVGLRNWWILKTATFCPIFVIIYDKYLNIEQCLSINSGRVLKINVKLTKTNAFFDIVKGTVYLFG